MKKKTLLTLPLLAAMLVGCGPTGGGDTPTPKPENKELEKFNSLVSAVKTGHNYSLHVHSQMLECEEEEILDCNYYAINDKAWLSDNTAYTYTGVISQKNQGFVYFDSVGETIVPGNFASTNPNNGISDFMDVIGENLFIDNYTQDSVNKSLFTTTGEDNIAVAAYMTQYYEYIRVGQLQVDESMTATLDMEAEKLTLKLTYWMYYYDEGEHIEESYIEIEFSNIGNTAIAEINSYVENPTYTYEAPTEWDEDALDLFKTYSPNIVPPFPTGASYAFTISEQLVDGYYYAGVNDKASGDLSTSYGAQLVNAGYTKTTDIKYTKLVYDDTKGMSISYTATLTFSAATPAFPNGVFNVYYRAVTTTGTFSSIEQFNNYLNKNGYDQLIPSLPVESTCTSISNFKDNTPTSEGYVLKFNGTDFFKVNIPGYTQAQAFVDSYIAALADKGYTDISKSPFGYSTYTFVNSGGIGNGTYVAISDFTSTNYKGYIQMNARVAEDDAEELRSKGSPLASIAISGYTTEYEIDDEFSFDGTCTATYETGFSKAVTPTNVTEPDMSTAGTKDIIVSYTEGGVTKTAQYQITVSEPATPKYNLSKQSGLTGGMVVLVSPSAAGEVEVGTTVKYKATPDEDYELESTFIVDYPEVVISKTLNPMTQTYTYSFVMPAHDCVVSATFKSTVVKTLSSIALSGTYQTEFEVGDTFNHDGLVVTATYDDESTTVVTPTEVSSPDMSSAGTKDVTVSYTEGEVTKTASYQITVSEPATPKYNLSKQSGLTGGMVVLVSPSAAGEVEVGTTVKYKATPDKNYELESTFIVDHPEVVISKTLNPMTQTYTYSFTMPEHDCVVSATFKSTAPATLSSIALSGTYKTEFEVGDTFNHDGLVVTATYSDSTNADVTADAEFSSPDMSTKGTKTVTVTYTEGEITKTATYDINVKEKEEPQEFTGGTYKFTTMDIDFVITFNSDGTGTYSTSGTSISFTWALSSTTMTLTRSDSKEEDNFGNYKLFNGQTTVTSQEIGTDYSYFKFTTYGNSAFYTKVRTFNKQ